MAFFSVRLNVCCPERPLAVRWTGVLLRSLPTAPSMHCGCLSQRDECSALVWDLLVTLGVGGGLRSGDSISNRL